MKLKNWLKPENIIAALLLMVAAAGLFLDRPSVDLSSNTEETTTTYAPLTVSSSTGPIILSQGDGNTLTLNSTTTNIVRKDQVTRFSYKIEGPSSLGEDDLFYTNINLSLLSSASEILMWNSPVINCVKLDMKSATLLIIPNVGSGMGTSIALHCSSTEALENDKDYFWLQYNIVN